MFARVLAVWFFVLTCSCCRASFASQGQGAESPASVSLAPVAIVRSVNVIPQPNGLAIEIALSAPVPPASNQITNPDRLVFDFPGCELQGSNRRIPVNLGPVRGLRLSLFSAHPLVTRLVVDSREPLNFAVQLTGNNVIIRIPFPSKELAPVDSIAHRAAAEHGHEVPSHPQPEQPEHAMGLRATASQPHAYGLLEKAKVLNVADLQPLEDKALAGDPEAETTLALAYHAGVLLKQDDREALRLLHMAADQGFMAAQESLGMLSESGVGMEQPSPAEALDWYRKAAQQGSLDAATNIALMYADGRGIPRDPAQAVTWFRRAAEGGDGAAQYNLALMFARGTGVPQDNRESIRWLSAAADQGVVPAILDLANVYMHPPDSGAPDVSRAIRYYEKAADLSNGLAQAILGNLFANGVQGKADYELSVKWYRKAAEQGQPDGQFGLGVRYALGQGVPADLVEARRLFTAAADQGHQGAQFDLGNLYEDGSGTPADRSLAAHYYQLAAEQGMVKAQYRLGLLLAKGDGSQRDRISAYKWLELAQGQIKEGAAALSDLRKAMNEQEISEAEREVDSWRTSHKKRQP